MHQISKHILSVECSSMAFAKEIQRSAAGLMQNEFYPKFERLLDKYSKEGFVWSIDCIEIEIPPLSRKNWKSELVEKALEKIESFLISSNKDFNRMEIRQQPGDFPGLVVSYEEYAGLLFLDYLKQGFFNQTPAIKTIDDIERSLISGKRNDVFKEKLIMLFAGYPQSLLRFIYTVSDKTRNIIKEEITGSTAVFRILQREIKYDKKLFSSSKDYRMWLEFLEWMIFLFDKNKISQSLLLSGFRNSALAYFGIHSEQIDEFFKNSDSSELIRLIEKFHLTVPENKIGSVSNPAGNSVSESVPLSYKRFDLKEALPDNQQNYSFNQSVYIQNSGLVIVHPFLIYLFERLNLYKDQEWTSKRNHHKAILISQYLITGQSVFFENELVLNKIICGLEPFAVINTQIKLSKKDIAEANVMLESVIAYWKMLKNTSIEGLRETFLNRNGKLVFSENGKYALWVEQKGVDVLMSHIPWGISMVKTPWMKNFLECNWI